MSFRGAVTEDREESFHSAYHFLWSVLLTTRLLFSWQQFSTSLWRGRHLDPQNGMRGEGSPYCSQSQNWEVCSWTFSFL